MSRRLTLTAGALLLAAGATFGAVAAGQAAAPAVPVHAKVVDSTSTLPAAGATSTDTGSASPAATDPTTAVDPSIAVAPAPAAAPSVDAPAVVAPTQEDTTTATTPPPAAPAAPTWSCTADGTSCTQHVDAPAGQAQPVAPPAAGPAPVAPVAPGVGEVPPPQH